MTDPKKEMLRHTLATLAYRGSKAVRDVPAGFEGFHASESSRTPGQILAHIGDLLDWALSTARGAESWHDSHAKSWDSEVERFHASLRAFDEYLATDAPLEGGAEKLFQGPVADALTHVGQICFLRRLAGAPVRGENYARAHIAAGHVGANQAPPRREFD